MSTADSLTTRFSFHVEYLDETGRVLRDQRLTHADFGHAIRGTTFDALRRGFVGIYQSVATETRVEPLFADIGTSTPRAHGFRVTAVLASGLEHSCDFDSSYFRPAANRMRSELTREELLSGEQELYFRLNAFLDEPELPPPASPLAITLGPPAQNTSIAEGCRCEFGPAEPWDEPLDTDVPVLIDEQVLEDAVTEARENPQREIAGFLLGRLTRDAGTHEVFVVVTGLASAHSTTEATAASVTYTPASFVEVRNIIQLRASGESVIGWYHSHPFAFCAECPLPTPPECLAKVLFYSQDDVHLMETTFEHPFMVGLLAAVEPRIEQAVGHLPVRLYGWRDGEIRNRGFEVIRPPDQGMAAVSKTEI